MKTSDSIKTLASALLKAQGEFTGVLKDKTNPHFKSKYADLQAAISATEEPLRMNGLLVIQTPFGSNATQSAGVTTRLLHVSGEWLEGELELPAGTQNRVDAQTFGSAITYARRYSYLGILGIAPEDDDGNVASGHAGPTVVRGSEVKPFKPAAADEERYTGNAIRIPRGDAFEADPLFDEDGNLIESQTTVQHREQKAVEDDTVPSTKPASGKAISEAQAKRWLAIAKSGGKSWEQINSALKAIGVSKAVEIPFNQYDIFIEWAGGKNERRA
jgi:hypothetical protein